MLFTFPSAFIGKSESHLPGRRNASAFTLVETLVVIGVIGLLLSLSVPAIQMTRESAAKVHCQSHLRQIALALHHYHADQNHLPPGRYNPDLAARDPQFLLTWLVQILPYLEQDRRYAEAVRACDLDLPPKNPPHLGMGMQFILYACPTDSRLRSPLLDDDGVEAVYGSYLGVAGAGASRTGLFAYTHRGPGAGFAECFDGLGNTLLLGERPPPDTLQAGQWYSGIWQLTGKYGQLRGPDAGMLVNQFAYGADQQCGSGPEGFRFGPGRTDNPCDRYHFWSLHSGGANFAFGDCSVRFLSYSIGRDLLAALATRNGGEPVTELD